ncbi:MAG TPA: hypothetical protein ENK18_22090 [Deltaproteobacteria bacterium]|nr:hypothetical protein [Deltaproteobacteria bacterium]
MRPFLIFGFASVLVVLTACGEPFAAAQKADTIESYEQYLKENPEGRFVIEASGRLEVLYLERAKAEETLEAYDAYLERFPEGAMRERALTERESFLYSWAKETNTAEGWQKYLDEYPKGKKKQRQHAKRMLEVHAYLPYLEVSPVRQEQINLAEDPEGPLNGWGFEADVTNNGDATITEMRLTIQYLSPEGGVLDEREWPIVAEYWTVPVEEERKVPMGPGQTRTWEWSTGDMPERWDRKVRLFVSRISLKEDG